MRLGHHGLALLGSLCVVALALAGCVSGGPSSESSRIPDAARTVWPPGPAVARIGYVQSVLTPADWGIERSAWTRFTEVFTGRKTVPFVRPTGVAERDGVLYVADPGARTLRILDAPRRKDFVVTRLGATMLASPVAVTPGPDGTVFLADSGHRKVFAVDRDGSNARVVIAEGLLRPAALAYDAARSRLYVADSMAHKVLVFSPDGRPLGDFGGHGLAPGEFNSPTHLALSRDGILFVTDALNFRVQSFDIEHRPVAAFGTHGDGAGNFAAPKGVAVDGRGRVYVADAMFDAVQVFRPDGLLLLGLGAQGTGPGQFWLPNGLYVTGADRLFVADAYNRRIQVFDILPGPPDEAIAK